MDEKKVLIIMAVAFALVVVIILGEIWLNSAAAEEGGYFILCRPGSVVNVRKNPKKTASVTAWVECGQRITVDREKNGYVHVTGLASEEPDGWIFAGYVVEEEPLIMRYEAEIWDGDVIARKCVNGKQIRRLKEGQIVTVYAKTHIWAVTSKGFVMCDWLKEVE
jgi:hypothetical protein